MRGFYPMPCKPPEDEIAGNFLVAIFTAFGVLSKIAHSILSGIPTSFWGAVCLNICQRADPDARGARSVAIYRNSCCVRYIRLAWCCCGDTF